MTAAMVFPPILNWYVQPGLVFYRSGGHIFAQNTTQSIQELTQGILSIRYESGYLIYAQYLLTKFLYSRFPAIDNLFSLHINQEKQRIKAMKNIIFYMK